MRGIPVQQHEIHLFLERFFTTNDCEIVENGDGWLTIQLTEEMDKALMNRPFYWQYIKSTGGIGEPMKLTLITEQGQLPSDKTGEVIHFGSPRLHQIFRLTRELGAFGRMYEQISTNTNVNTPLHPWLVINTKISYQCDRKKDQLFSIGLHLISGTMINQFHQHLTKVELTPKIPDYCFTMSPIIKPASGIKRIESVISKLIENDDHTWAKDAQERWDQDLLLLEKFYEGLEERPDAYTSEKEALRLQYEPKVTASFVNGGLFYLTQGSINITA